MFQKIIRSKRVNKRTYKNKRKQNDQKKMNLLLFVTFLLILLGNYCQAYVVTFLTVTHNSTLQEWADEDGCQINIDKRKKFECFSRWQPTRRPAMCFEVICARNEKIFQVCLAEVLFFIYSILKA